MTFSALSAKKDCTRAGVGSRLRSKRPS
jgi:hypothetical protein